VVEISLLSGKVAEFFADIEEMNIHYISTPRKLLLKKAMVINRYLFFLYIFTINFYIALLFVPVYVFLVFLFYMFTKICEKYRYKKAILFSLFILFNTFSFAAAIFLRTFLMDIIGL
jgi:hypothetical protein